MNVLDIESGVAQNQVHRRSPRQDTDAFFSCLKSNRGQERQTPANENLAYEFRRRFDISSGEALGDDAKMCSHLGVVNVFGNDSGVV